MFHWWTSTGRASISSTTLQANCKFWTNK